MSLRASRLPAESMTAGVYPVAGRPGAGSLVAGLAANRYLKRIGRAARSPYLKARAYWLYALFFGLLGCYLGATRPMALMGLLLTSLFLVFALSVTNGFFWFLWKSNLGRGGVELARRSRRFATWFAGHNLAWSGIFCLACAFFLIWFGPRFWIVALIGAGMVCCFMGICGMGFWRIPETGALCWSSEVPDGLIGYARRMEATLVLGQRYEYAVLKDLAKPNPFLPHLTRVVEKADDLNWLPPAPETARMPWKKEISHRATAFGTLFLGAFLVMALFLSLIGGPRPGRPGVFNAFGSAGEDAGPPNALLEREGDRPTPDESKDEGDEKSGGESSDGEGGEGDRGGGAGTGGESGASGREGETGTGENGSGTGSEGSGAGSGETGQNRGQGPETQNGTDGDGTKAEDGTGPSAGESGKSGREPTSGSGARDTGAADGEGGVSNADTGSPNDAGTDPAGGSGTGTRNPDQGSNQGGAGETQGQKTIDENGRTGSGGSGDSLQPGESGDRGRARGEEKGGGAGGGMGRPDERSKSPGKGQQTPGLGRLSRPIPPPPGTSEPMLTLDLPEAGPGKGEGRPAVSRPDLELPDSLNRDWSDLHRQDGGQSGEAESLRPPVQNLPNWILVLMNRSADLPPPRE